MSDKDSDTDLDWFDKDDDEIVRDVLNHKDSKFQLEDNTEYIASSTSATDEFLKQHNLSVAAAAAGISKVKLSTPELRKLLQNSEHQPLDIFLFAVTYEVDYFSGQLLSNDSQERALLYTRTLRIICDLELPGYHVNILRKIIQCDVLLLHFRVVCSKLFSKTYKNLWKDEKHVDQVISDMQALFLHAQQACVMTPKAIDLMQHISKLLESSNSPTVSERTSSVEFAKNIAHILKSWKGEQNIESKTEIYPTLAELKQTPADNIANVTQLALPTWAYESAAHYIEFQKQILREDFMIPLREFVQSLKSSHKLPDTLQHSSCLYEDVQIVLNDTFLNAHRHEMLFVDVLANMRIGADNVQIQAKLAKKEQNKLGNLKTGTLLCFTMSYEFDNLILATITYTDKELLRSGYIGIEILRQYNIGNIYNKPLIMFETPAFFEPFNNVYNYLNDCSTEDFPMQQYIVSDESAVKPPSYLDASTTFLYQNIKFKPFEMKPPHKLPLDQSQLLAFSNALKQEFTLIQGPPGTGKTHLSVHLVKTLIDNVKNKPIVVITYTNDSLDKFLLKLSKHTESIARFGGQTRLPEIMKYNVHNAPDENYFVNPRLKRLYFVTKQEFKAKFEHLQVLQNQFDGSDESYQIILTAQREVRAVLEKLDCIRVMFQYYRTRNHSIIAMTTTCAAKINFLFRLLKSSIVVFEEAAEILESHVTACLTPYTQHVIMIGDHMQLQPYTTSYRHSRTYEMNISLFERLIKREFPYSLLKTQYRMQPAIAALISPIIYKDLCNDHSVDNYPAIRKMQTNLYFLTHNHYEEVTNHDNSICNEYEAKQIVKLAKYLLDIAKYGIKDMVILTPYEQQVQRITSKLVNYKKLQNLRVATVDSYQGLEEDIVLLSLVRSNEHNKIGFLKEQSRICVALSRAKYGLYIIGNMPMLAKCSTTWSAVAKELVQQDVIGDENFPYSSDGEF